MIKNGTHTYIHICICIQSANYMLQVAICTVLVNQTCNSLNKARMYGRNV